MHPALQTLIAKIQKFYPHLSPAEVIVIIKLVCEVVSVVCPLVNDL